MNRELFTNNLKERLEELTECKVILQTNTKNNGVKMESLVIMREGQNAAPTIYTDIWWEVYNEGESFETIVIKVLEWERKAILSRRLDLDFFLDFHKVKENLRFKIINTEKNIEILNDIPHKDFLDLSKAYYVEIRNEEIGTGTVLITNKHMQMWGTNLEDIDKYATDNTEQRNPYCIFPMEKIAEGLMKEIAGTEEDIPDFRIPPMEMYVLTNQQRFLGASVLLCKNVLKDFVKEKEDDLYILPSSTHELIVIPARVVWYTGINHLKEIVKEVNSTQVEPEEFLSNNVYRYDRETDKIEIV
ncbi:MAG: hypothetical protein IKV59_02970 [Lachnospiraceae bacterium]|nr:hypothetical protein [Lachnospiraceae bacterium]